MDPYLAMLTALVALLGGLAVGKAWERYKLHEGTWVDRRRLRESPHYILGLNFLVAGQIDLAIGELSAASRIDPGSLEIPLILGNLYREKGQVGRAIHEHQGLLQRPKLRKLEHANVLLCLGLDFRRGGFIDRAVEAFTEVLRLDPTNEYALINLEKLYAEQQQWEQAYAARQRLADLTAGGARAGNQTILAFLEHALGQQARAAGDRAGAARRFQAAIDLHPAMAPAFLNLGDVRLDEGSPQAAADAWEELVRVAPDRAFLAFSRLERVYRELGTPEKFPALCRGLIDANPLEWRARLALARYKADHGQPAEGLERLLEAVTVNPHALVIHQAIWSLLSELGLPRALVARYTDLTREAIFYLDPHVCTRCRYRSTELLWQCPHCHEWNTFVEERLSPAKDDDLGEPVAR